MDQNIEFLNYIYQNAEMGKDTINHLLDIAEDQEFKKTLESQLKEYNEIHDLAYKKLEETRDEAKGIGTFQKFSSNLMINLNTLTNKSPSHIAEMMIQGTTMGIVDVTKKLKEYENADKDVAKLGDRLLKFEQQNVEEMKKYLH